MKKVTTFVSENRTFHIVKDDRGYWGIEDKHLDQNGCLSVKLNGMSGHLHDTLEATLESIRFQTKLDKLIASGMSFEDAARIMWTAR